MKLLLIRHGRTAANRFGLYQGRTDEPLSEEGKRDILNRKEKGYCPWVPFVAASPMQRCVQTARLLYGRSPELLIDEWKEIDFGKWEGKSYAALKGDSDYRKWVDSGGTLPFPGGESREAFTKRCMDGLHRFCEWMQAENGTETPAAAIVHGGTIMALLSVLGEGDYFDYRCGNGEGYVCDLFWEKTIRVEHVEKLACRKRDGECFRIV